MNTLLDAFVVESISSLEETPDFLAEGLPDWDAEGEDRPATEVKHALTAAL